MKKKKNSLLNQLTQENNSINNSLEILRDIEDCKINHGTELRRRLQEIWDLQKKENVDSAKKIDELLKEEFSYEYPFDYKVDFKKVNHLLPYEKGANFAHTVSKKVLSVNDTLKNHIVREDKLNSLINKFNKTIDVVEVIDEKEKVRKKIIYASWIIGGLLSLYYFSNWNIILNLIVSFFLGMFLFFICIYIYDLVHYKPYIKSRYSEITKITTELFEDRAKIN